MLVYYSVTGNCKRFAEKINKKHNYPICSIREYKNGKFILLTPTYGFGEIPAPTKKFLSENRENCIGVISSGNMNWGNMFAIAGDKASLEFDIPLLMKIEQAGNAQDIETFGGLIG